MPPSPSAPDPAEMTFEDALSRLEALVEALENDPPDLDAALKAYAEGTALARHCLERLQAAELRVEELSLE